VRAELYRVEAPESPVAIATWSQGRGRLEVLDGSIPELGSVLRATPVVVDDPSLRRPGTSGASMLEPGSAEWFRAALIQRCEPLGLQVRFVAEEIVGGWDPAAAYRTFGEQIERLTSS